MKTITTPILLILALVAGIFAGCAPSAENEGKYWANHQKDATALKAEWAGFTAVIDGNIAAAKTAHDAAAKITDEEKKAEAMKAANGIASKVTGKIQEVKSKIKGLEDDITKLNKLKLTKSQVQTRSRAVNKGYEAIDGVKAAMVAAKPANEEEALKIAKDQVSALISASGAVNRTTDSLKPAKKKKKKKKKRKK